MSGIPSDAGLTGYSRSKWVAEVICAAAAKKLPGKVNIFRIGQLTGDTENGIWNISEVWPLLLSTVDALDCLPEIKEPLNWLPLDTAAAAIVDISFDHEENDDEKDEHQSHVYHLVNNDSETTWSNLLAWSLDARAKPFDIVSPTAWLEKLERYPNKHPAKNLLGLWRKSYGRQSKETDSVIPVYGGTAFEIVEARKRSSAMQNIPPIDQALVKKIWFWLEDEIRIAKVQVYVSRNRYDGASPPPKE